jgi:hypothetical protein
MNRMKTIRWSVLLALFASGCVSRGYPTHGGGKRFFREQEVVGRAIDAAVESLQYDRIPAEVRSLGVLPVQMFSLAHSGGGVQTSSNIGVGAVFGSLFGSGAVGDGGADLGAPAAVAVTGSGPGSYASYAFESADDARYLMGALMVELAKVGIRPGLSEKAGDTQLYVLVKELGIDQNDLNLIVYGEKRLAARVVLEAWLVYSGDVDGKVGKQRLLQSLGRGEATYTFSEDFFLGFGPLNSRRIEGAVTDERGEGGK